MIYRIFVFCFVAIIAIGMVLLFPRHDDTGRSALIQYRETLHFARGGGTFSAQGVMQQKLVTNGGGTNPAYGGGGVSTLNVWLEAIPVPVGGGDYVFALPRYPYDANHRTMLLYDACALPVDERGKSNAVAKVFISIVTTLDRVCDVPMRSWPILIHFKDMTRPTTAERIFPSDMLSRFGVSLESVTAERTDDPPTRGIQSILPWAVDPKLGFEIPVTTVETRSGPIILTAEDFRWPSPRRKTDS